MAAPLPTNTMRVRAMSRSVTRRALSRPARVTVAVPCWSSCQTGIGASARRRSRMRKHLGWAMSSRLMPPKEGLSSSTVRISSSGSRVSSTIGTASTPPRYLYSRALPSITGSPAAGPMSPRPSTRVPSLTTATVLPLLVYS
ncbi:MAG: hypothetical protein A2064_09195 [Spirochaetes bacterium GWB1_66_5]|nr:MAG: hypothetical protein A2064_09195 [Spirochaetes bacterium GWB1_66_5]